MCEGESGVAPGEFRIERDSAFKHSCRDRIVLHIEAVHVLQAEVISRPGIETIWRLETGTTCLVQRDLQFESIDDGAYDFFADFVHSTDCCMIPVAPHNASFLCVGEFHRDRHSVAQDLDCAGKAVSDVQGCSDL